MGNSQTKNKNIKSNDLETRYISNVQIPNVVIQNILNYLLNYSYIIHQLNALKHFLSKYTLINKEWNEKIIPKLTIERPLYHHTINSTNLFEKVNYSLGFLMYSSYDKLLRDDHRYKVTKLTTLFHDQVSTIVQHLPMVKQVKLEFTLPYHINLYIGMDLESWKQRNILVDIFILNSVTLDIKDFSQLYRYCRNIYIADAVVKVNGFNLDYENLPISTIRCLNLASIAMSTEIVKILLKKSPHLVRIKLQNIRDESENSDGILDEIINFILGMDYSNLELLKIVNKRQTIQYKTLVNLYNRIKVTDFQVGFSKVLEHGQMELDFTGNVYIQSLQIFYTPTVASLKALFNGCKNVSSFYYYGSDMKVFSQILQMNLPSLTSVYVDVDLETSISEIIDSLRNNRYIITFSIGSISLQDLEKLITNNLTLLHLNIYNLGCDPTQYQELIVMIKNNKTLQRLIIKAFSSHDKEYNQVSFILDIYKTVHQIYYLHLPFSTVKVDKKTINLYKQMLQRNPHILYLTADATELQQLSTQYFVRYIE
ncbi:hypothetical protein DLAC_00894 [Tieghemostelium lacteum]|uniref:F-box domain-containing protein n=1 Tax=Tieghemostelium lacteum TaxID=361077 RepID=A0A152A7C6_TIELA|nr:hypothetical protein DLAC_00894 [Tieghemostelium lacteum]|eukprot:KYR02094.1 hypothetical protein DLAC_00894 [Tieghemostelium lacteum]